MKIIYTRPDGGVSIISPAGKFTIEEVFAKDVPADAINPKIVDDSYIPSDRTHRNEWVDKGNKIEPDAKKVQDKIARIAQEEAEIQAIFTKIGLTKEEFEKLPKGRLK